MFLYILRFAIRIFQRNRLISFINVFGLAISLSVFTIIFSYINRELQYDTGHKDYERIFRLVEVIKSENYKEQSASCPWPAGSNLASEYPNEIESFVRFFNFQMPSVNVVLDDNSLHNESKVYFVDANVFEFFDFKILENNSSQEILGEPLTAAISQKVATKYFGKTNPLGQKIKLDAFPREFEITGVFEQLSPSHLKPDILLSMITLESYAPFLAKQWVWNPAWTYLKLYPGANDRLQKNFPDFIQKHYHPAIKNGTSHFLQPIQDIHLYSSLEFEISENSNIQYVQIFISCAVFLLVVAIVNFVNLSVSITSLRNREIGIRKVLGASKNQLKIQFITESVLIVVVSFVISLILCLIMIDILQHSQAIDLFFVLNFHTISILFFVSILIGVLTGIYPALALSGLHPTDAIKKKFTWDSKSSWLRKCLVVGQFCIAIILINFTIIIYQQVNLLHHRTYGFDKQDVIVLNVTATNLSLILDEFKSDLKSNSEISHVSIMSDMIGAQNNNHEYRESDRSGAGWNFYPALLVDEEFVKTLGIQLIAGRDFDDQLSREDYHSILINRTMSRMLGFNDPNDAIGYAFNSHNGNEKIVGIVEDFNYKSLHSSIGPFVLDIGSSKGIGNLHFRYVVIKVSQINDQTVNHIADVWRRHIPQKPFTYKTLANEMDGLYKTEDSLARLTGLFSLLSVFIASFGMYAINTKIVQQRAKEFGIRKVLGATYLSLFISGYREQMTLVMIAFLVAIPVSYLAANEWLSSFAFKIDIDLFPFALTGILVVAITAFTIFLNFHKCISANPADTLRDE